MPALWASWDREVSSGPRTRKGSRLQDDGYFGEYASCC